MLTVLAAVAAAAHAQQVVLLDQQQAKVLAREQGWVVHRESPAGVIELQAIVDGMPRYYMTHNADAADTVGTDECLPGGGSGLALTGLGVTLGIWDGGGVRTTHREFGGRAIQRDSVSGTSAHATHVSGTLIASGVSPTAKGMSPAASLDCYDWNSDTTEMRSAAAAGLRVSNHSYGYVTGWYYNYFGDGEWAWFGDTRVSSVEDYRFGFYSDEAAAYDDVAYDHPYYLICKSAGNDRSDNGPAPGGGHWYFNHSAGRWRWSTDPRDPDGPYDCVGEVSVAKNILSVAAVGDVAGGYAGPGGVSMSSFSAWGPADDGRIKPDISANGIGLYSSDSGNDQDYATFSGTSMASPNLSGSLGLLIQHWRATHAGDMRAATLKGLVLHTADECGAADGPDYAYGWGLLNTEVAAYVISDDVAEPLTITEWTIASGEVLELYVSTDGTADELRATICWTDPAGTPPGSALDPVTPMLVNDLDLRIEQATPTATFYPWMLDPANPAAAATTGDNAVDNVEQVVVYSPGTGSYTVRVTPDGALAGGSQAFSLILTGAATISETGGYVLAVETVGQGDVELTPAGGVYDPNTVVELNATADAGWTFDHWELDLAGAANPASLVMDADKTVRAVFAPEEYTLTVETAGSGTVAADPNQATYAYGAIVELTAAAEPGWAFDRWELDLTGSANPASLTMDGGKTVRAVFVQAEYTLAVETVGSGTVAADPNQATYAYGAIVELTAAAESGWAFDRWELDLTGSANPASLTMDGGKTVRAVFVQEEYTLTVETVGSGTVARDPDQATYLSGVVAQLAAVAEAGWAFDHWELDLSGAANPASLTMDGDKTVRAVFAPEQYTLTVSTAGQGAVTVIPEQPTYVYGAVVELTAIADLGWTFDHWSGDLGGAENPASLAVTGNASVTAHFVQELYTLTFETAGSGGVSADPTQATYTYGQVVQLTAAGDPGWVFDHWELDLTGSANPASVTMDGNKTVRAVFAPEQYMLSVSVAGSGTVAVDPNQATYTYGQIVQLTATAQPGWRFDHWSGDVSGTENPASLTITGSADVTAHFVEEQYTLAVETVGRGSVTADPDQVTYTYGTIVALSATADTGWVFDHWEVDLTGSANPASVTMDGNKTARAVFAPEQYTLTIESAGEGAVLLDPNQSTYTLGQVVTLTATADPGWAFDHWSGDVSGTENPASLTIAGNASVTAHFVQETYVLTLQKVGEGTVLADPNQTTYTYGQVVQVTATAQSGWAFDHWSGDLSGAENPASLTLTANADVTAHFVQEQYTLSVEVAGNGAIAIDPEQISYTYGQVVDLTATADPGWAFDRWELDLTGAANPASLTVDGDKTVRAVFIPVQYTLTVQTAGEGDVTADPAQATYVYGDIVALTAAAAPAWLFDRWSGDLTGSDNPASLTIAGDATVLATFVPDCNGNSVPDSDDLADGTSLDGNGNGVPDECDLPGDLDGDGAVGAGDFLRLLDCMAGPDILTPPEGCDPPLFALADLDRDGDVDLVDAGLFQAVAGE